MFKQAVPILGVANVTVAAEYYCGKLGFRREYAYQPDPQKVDPCYMGLVRDGAHLAVSSFEGDGPPGNRKVQIYVDDAAAVYEEFKREGVSSLGEIFDQTWGNIEFGCIDPDGNRLVIAQNAGSDIP